MLWYILRTFLQLIAVATGVLSLVFVLIFLTSDPVALLAPLDASPEDREILREQLGLNDPLAVQYWRYMKRTIGGDFGKSVRMGQSALPLVLERVPATVELGTSGLLIAALVGVSIGILSAIRRDTWIDALGRFLALGSQAMPTFWLGLMLIIIFAVKLRLLPAFGRGEMRHLIMPAVTLATYNIPIILRITRSAFIEVIHQDYIRTARAKGVPENVITFQHILRNAAIPIVTVLGMNFGWMLAGAIAVETVFSWPGIGYFTLQAIFLGDYPVVMASTVILVMGVVIVNFLTDLTYGFLDPRIRYWGKK